MKVKKTHQGTLYIMLSIILAQIFVPTVYKASEVNANTIETFATIDDFVYDENTSEYALTFYADDEVNLKFYYAEDAAINDYDYHLNEKQLDLEQDVSTAVGENSFTIKPLADDAGDISTFALQLTNTNLKHVSFTPVESESTGTTEPSETEVSEVSEDSTISEDSAVSEEKSETTSATTNKAKTATTRNLNDVEYVSMGLKEFWEKSQTSNPTTQYVTYTEDNAEGGPVGDTITMLNKDASTAFCVKLGYQGEYAQRNCTEGRATSLTTDFAVTAVDDFHIDAEVYIREDGYTTDQNKVAADAFGFFYTGNPNPYAVGQSGINYGIAGLADTYGVVMDYFSNNFQTAYTNSSGTLSKGYEDYSNAYKLVKGDGFKKYIIEGDYDADTNTYTSSVKAYAKNGTDWNLVRSKSINDFAGGSIKFPTNSKSPIKLTASENDSKSEIRIASLNFSGYVKNNIGISNITNPQAFQTNADGEDVDQSTVQFGQTQTMEIYASNTTAADQDITYTNWNLENYTEDGNSFIEKEDKQSANTINQKLTDDDYVNNVSTHDTSTISVEMSALNPADLSKEKQLELIANPGAIKATMGTDLIFPAFENAVVPISITQTMSGDNAEIIGDDKLYTASSIDDEAATMSWVLTQLELNDPYATKLSLLDFYKANDNETGNKRVEWENYQVTGDTATVDLRVRGLNNMWVTKQITIVKGNSKLTLDKTFAGAKYGQDVAATNDELTFNIEFANNNADKTGVVLDVTPDADDIVGDIFDVVIKNGDNRLTIGTDYVVENNTISFLKPINSFAKVTIEYKEKTVSQFNDYNPITDLTTIHAEGEAPAELEQVVNKEPAGTHKLTVEKTVTDQSGNDQAANGEGLTYTVAITNTGLKDETNVNVLDAVTDSNLDLSTLTIGEIVEQGGATLKSSSLDATEGLKVVADMPKDSRLEINFNVNVKSGGIRRVTSFFTRATNRKINNDVTVTSDLIRTPIEATATIPLDYNSPGMVDLTLSKTLQSTSDGDMLADADETLNYQLMVENTGAIAQENIVISDQFTGEFNGGITNLEVKNGTTPLALGTDYSIDDANQQILINELADGQQLTITYSLKTATEFTSFDPLVNTASAVSDEFTKDINTEVSVEKDLAANGMIAATDIQVKLSAAPKSEAALIKLLAAEAIDVDGAVLTNQIYIKDLNRYVYSTPTTGEYVITLAVKGKNKQVVTTTAKLSIVSEANNSANIAIYGNEPVYIIKGSGESADDVINSYAQPVLIEETSNGQYPPLSLNQSSIVTDSGFDSSQVGVYPFKITALGANSNLEAEATIAVYVVDSESDIPVSTTIDGQDISILKGSYYDRAIASVLHAKSSSMVSAQISENGALSDAVTLAQNNIVYTNVDTSSVGDYTTTFSYTDKTSYSLPVEATDQFAVHVVDANESTNAVISATDYQVKLGNAPKTEAKLLTALKVKAMEANGLDLTSAIKINDFGGYNIVTPAIGHYVITLSVKGSDGVQVTTTATIDVVANVATYNQIEMKASSPIVILNDSGESAADVINKYGNGVVLETMAGTLKPTYTIDSDSIVSSGGYQNDKNGTYVFKLETTGKQTNLTVSKLITVIVTDDPASVDAYGTINGQDIKVLKGSSYDSELAVAMHRKDEQQVTAQVSTKGTVSSVALDSTNVIQSNVDTSTVGQYVTSFSYEDKTSFATPIATVDRFKVEVVEKNEATNAVISVTDKQLDVKSAPKTEAQLLTAFDASAVEANGSDLTSRIVIDSLGGYNLTTPKSGTYTMKLSVTGADGIRVTTTAVLKIVNTGASRDRLTMEATTPIVVTNGSGESPTEVIDNYANAMVVEVMAGKVREGYAIDSKSLVSSGGYDNTKNGTYIFKLETIGVESKLKISKLITVIVTDDPTTVPAYGIIDGQDVTILQGSYYSKNLATIIHPNKHESVAAEITESGVVSVDSLNGTNVIQSNVDPNIPCTYTTTFAFNDKATYATPVSAVRTFTITVVGADESTNAEIGATDAEVNLKNAPTTKKALLDLIHAEAVETDGSDLTESIVINTMSGYDFSAPAIGEYIIGISVVGADGVKMIEIATLRVVANNVPTDGIEMVATSPIIVANGSRETAREVIDNYANAVIVETVDGTIKPAYSIGGESLMNAGGYNNDVNGTYSFKLESIGSTTGLRTTSFVNVIVTDDPDSEKASAAIDGQNITVLQGSLYNRDLAATLHAKEYDKVTAKVTENGRLTPVTLTAANYLGSDVNTETAGEYQTTFAYRDSASFTTPVTAVKTFKVTVVPADENTNAVISGSDSEVKIEDAPRNKQDLLVAIQAEAAEVNGIDRTSKIIVDELGGYDYNAPAIGEYSIQIGVVGTDGVRITTTVKLKVVANEATVNNIVLGANTPLVVAKGSGDSAGDVITKYANAMVMETVAGTIKPGYAVGSDTIVSSGGYENNTSGTYTFKLKTTGQKTGMIASKLVKVIVSDDPTTINAYARIDGQDIKVLQGSTYNPDLAVTLLADNYSKVTAEVFEDGVVTPVTLSSENEIANNVDPNTVGQYQTTYRYLANTFAAPVEAVKTFNVTVVKPQPAENAVISGTDKIVNLENAPTTVTELVTAISGKATEADGTAITNRISVDSLGGYDLTNPQIGQYQIGISVVGKDGVTVATNATLKVVANGQTTNSIAIKVTNPIVILNGSGENAANVIDNYGNPMVVEKIDGLMQPGYTIGSETIVSDGGYNNNKNGTYSFKLAAIGKQSKLNVSTLITVIVTDDPDTVESYGTIDGQDIKVLQGSYYDKASAVGLHASTYAQVTAVVNEIGTVSTINLSSDNILASNVNTNIAGEYATTFNYQDQDSFTTPVSAVKTLKVTVVKASDSTNAVLSATDRQVKLADAPQTQSQLLTAINAQASEANGTDITNKIKIDELGGYNLDRPEVGPYTIQISVVGSDGVRITSQVTIEIVKNEDTPSKIAMAVTSPIIIANGSGENAADVIDSYANAMVVETIDNNVQPAYSVDSAGLISAGGYDNDKNGTYSFKISATGNQTGLEISKIIPVIVTDDPATIAAYATIDGQDIKVLKGSSYDRDLAAILHADSDAKVSAKVSASGVVTSALLDGTNVIESNVDTSVASDYTTTFAYSNKNEFANAVQAVKTYSVHVVEADEATNAVLSAVDSEVKLSAAPQTTDDLLTALKVQGMEVNGVVITNKITVESLGGYNLSAPTTGTYPIKFGVVGADGVRVTASAKLTVTADDTVTTKMEIKATSPIVVTNGSNETATDVIDKYANPMVIESIGDTANQAYAIDSRTIVSTGGYDNRTNGNYVFKLETNGIETGLKGSILIPVIVTDDINAADASGSIDGQDIKVLEGSNYSNDLAPTLHSNHYSKVSVVVLDKGTSTNSILTGANIIASNVDTSTVGEYTTTFAYTTDSKFSTPVSAVKTFKVEVIAADQGANAIISADDAETKLANAPKSNEQILDLINARAIETDYTDTDSDITIDNLGGYNLKTPKVGIYNIQISVVGSDGVRVTTAADLKVVNNAVVTNEVEIKATNPIVILNDSGETAADVIDTYANAMVMEKIKGNAKQGYTIGSEALVSSGGYDNRINGTYSFKLETIGKESGLKVSKVIKVIVTDNPSSIDAYARIDGQDITVLQGSYYGKNLATILHPNKYEYVKAEVSQAGVITPVILNGTNVIQMNVNTSIPGEYTTTFAFDDETSYSAPVEAVETFKVSVVEAEDKSNAEISVTDAEVQLTDAPKTPTKLLELIQAQANEANGTDISESIIINTTGGYDFDNPQVGEYIIGISVVGSDGVKMIEIATMRVVTNQTLTDGIEMRATNPIVIAQGSGESASDVIDLYANASVIETVDGIANPAYQVDSTTIMSAGGYDNNVSGMYSFKLEAIGAVTGLRTTKLINVIVTADPNTVDSYGEINGQDITVLAGSSYDQTLAATLHAKDYAQVTATVSAKGIITPVTLDATNVIGSNVDTSRTGEYTTTFAYSDKDTFANAVSAVKPYTVTVVEQDVAKNAVISATDDEIMKDDAPRTNAALIATLGAAAAEADGTDITSKITVESLGGYNLSAPAIGTYTIGLSVVGVDGVRVTTSATIKVVADGAPSNAIRIDVSSPIVITNGSGENAANVIDKYGNPMVIESISGDVQDGYAIGSESIVSDGGYNNRVNGTYSFKLEATGNQSLLKVATLVTVIVTDDPAQVAPYATIDGQDIKVLAGSSYTSNLAATLHAKAYPQVSAEVTVDGTSTPFALDASNIIASNVDTSIVGEYTTTFSYRDQDSFSSKVSAVNSYNVTVVEADETNNAVISSTDSEVNLDEAPSHKNELLTAIKAQATEANGTELTSAIMIDDLGGYNLSAPKIGSYNIQISVVGSDGVRVTSVAILKVVANGSGTNEIEIHTSTPIVITNGSRVSADDVIDIYGNPMVVETINGSVKPAYAIDHQSIVSTGGYDNNTNGTYSFKLATTGQQTNLNGSTLVTVIVTDDPASVDSYGTIVGQDINVLQGSYYDKDLAAVLHSSDYSNVTAKIVNHGEITPVTLTGSNVIATNVDTSIAGEYNTTFSYRDESAAVLVQAVETFKVTVVVANEGENAVISASDAQVNQENAPTTNGAVIAALDGQATEADATDITGKITIDNLGGYNLTTPAVGTYTIGLSVVGADDVRITTTAKLKVVASGDKINSIEMIATNPIVIAKDSGENPSQIIENYANPMVIETINQQSNSGYAVGSETIVSTGGYENSKNGTYSFKLETVGVESGLKVSTLVTVIVTDNPDSIATYGVIDGQDIKVLKGSSYDQDLAATLHAKDYAQVTAQVSDHGTITPVALAAANIIESNVNPNINGEYTTTFSYRDQDTFAEPVAAVETFTVTVVEKNPVTNAQLSATDVEVKQEDGPTTPEELLGVINAKATEANGTNITSKINIDNLGGYSFTAPAIGEYTITLSVVGTDGVRITSPVTIKIVGDEDPTNGIEMKVTTPIVVTNGSGETAANVIDTYANAIVIETVAGTVKPVYQVDSETIISNGGYDNLVNGTYSFKLETTGVETDLKVSTLVPVIVTDNPNATPSHGVIDGIDITLLEGSHYGVNLAPILHENKYEQVTAEITDEGEITPIKLDGKNVIATNVNTEIPGEYRTTFAYENQGDFANPVEVVKTLKVSIVAASEGTNAVISASDAQVNLSAAPTSKSELLAAINAKATEADGTNITGSIIVNTMSGYNFAAPAVGEYLIGFSVVGRDGVKVVEIVTLNIVADDAKTNAISLKATTPIIVTNGSGETAAEVIDNYANGMVVETVGGKVNPAYAVGSEAIVRTGGYDNMTNGTYNFKLETIGTVTGLKTSTLVTVIVTDDPSNETYGEIDGLDITVLKGSYYTNQIATSIHQDKYDQVTAKVTDGGEITLVPLTDSNIIESNVDTKAAGEYTTTFAYQDQDTFTAPVSIVKTYNVTVVDPNAATNAVISASDAQVNVSDAPTSKADLLTVINAKATEADAKDITNSIVVNTMSGYNFTAPAVGKYTIGISVIGNDGVKVVEVVTLSIVADGTTTNRIGMKATSPIVISRGSGETAKQVIDKHANAMVIETIGGVIKPAYAVGSETIVSNGGYDNMTNGTYNFKLETTGKQSGLKGTTLVTVIVTDNPDSIDGYGVIDGQDIKVLKGSSYDQNLAVTLHAKSYSKVTAKVSDGGTITPVTLTAENVIASNINTSTLGNYTTTFAYSGETPAGVEITAVQTLNVTVVAPDFATNAVISGNDAKVELTNAPKSTADLLTAFNARATEVNNIDITSKIVIDDLGGYSFELPTAGKYSIQISVVGKDGVKVTMKLSLEVVADGTPTSAIEMIATDPITITKGSGESAVVIVNRYANPMVIETVDGIVKPAYAVGSTTLVSDGGYNNNVNGTYNFKLQTTGKDTKLKVSTIVTVTVTDKPETVASHGTINGRDIKVLKGSYYNDNLAVTLHGSEYPQVTAKVVQAGSVTPVTLTSNNIISNNVDTSATGDYVTTFAYTENDRFTTPVTAVKSLYVNVVEKNASTNALISATDTQLQLADAPTTKAELITAINGVATEANNKIITNKIKIDDLDGYDFAYPTIGEYQLSISVTGDDGVRVTQSVMMKIVADEAATNSIDLKVTSPIVIAKGSGETATDVIDEYANPMVIETIGGEKTEAYAIDHTAIISNGGYNNNTLGTYNFKLETKGRESELTISKIVTVIVTDQPNNITAYGTINGQDINVLVGSSYTENIAATLHASKYSKVTAEVSQSGAVTPVALSASNVINSNVDTTTVGRYTTVFSYEEDSKFDSPVSVVKPLAVNVIAANDSENGVISATDTEVNLNNAPTTSDQLLTLINAQATEADGTVITDKILIDDLDGYDFTAPAVGQYTIQISVVGNDGVRITTSIELNIAPVDAEPNTIQLLATSPIVITNGSKETAAEVIDKYASPMVVETIAGVANDGYFVGSETLASSGGYDNNVNGTYSFKLSTIGTETDLKVSTIVKVIVTDESTTTEAYGTIDGQDITILEGSSYDRNLAVTLHAREYAKVTAKVVENEQVTPVALTASNVIASNVNTSAAGEYTTTFAFTDKDTYPTPIAVVEGLKVTVVEADAATNAIISATDQQVKLHDAPLSEEELLSTIKAQAMEADSTNINNQIKIDDLGGYNLTAPNIGTYSIQISVTGKDEVRVATRVNLQVLADKDSTNQIEIKATTPIVINRGSGETADDIVNSYVNAMVIETSNNNVKPGYGIGSEALVSNGGYDNNENGTYTFKLEATGNITNLYTSTLITVIVTDNPEEVSGYGTIDGQDISILQGSYYTNRLATILHTNKYAQVTAEITAAGETTPIALDENNIIASNVNPQLAGEYATTFGWEAVSGYTQPIAVVRTFSVTVVPTNEATNAVISASDAEVELSDAPTTKAELLASINAQAAEPSGADLTASIVVNTMGGYDFDNPTTGEYIIGISIVGEDGVKVIEVVTLKIVEDLKPTNNGELIVTDPIVINNGSRETAADVIDTYGNPMVRETVDTKTNPAYGIGSETLVSSGGYDNNTNGTYIFKLSTIGQKTNLKLSTLVKVIVTDNPQTIDSYGIIDGQDIKVLEGSLYNEQIATILHQNKNTQVTAEISERGTITTESLDHTNILASNVDTSKVGEYTTTFAYLERNQFAKPVAAVETFKVTVVENQEPSNAIISATDKDVSLDNAPTTKQQLLNGIQAKAIETDGTNITNKIVIIDQDGYDFSNPNSGQYKITIGVRGDDGVFVTTDVKLTIIGEKDQLNQIEMLVTSPVIVEVGNKMDPQSVIEQLIYPTIIETENGRTNNGYLEDGSVLVSAGGYDNNSVGTYYFKLKATGIKTGLETEQIVKVIVTDNPVAVDQHAEIDGRDIRLLAGSSYDVANVSKVHAKDYDEVTAEIATETGQNIVNLNGNNVVASNVDPTTPGTYQTIFYYNNTKAKNAAEQVSVVKPFVVKVIDVAEGANEIEFTKTVKAENDSDVASNSSILNYNITVKNTSEDLVFNNLTVTDPLVDAELKIENLESITIIDQQGNDVTANYNQNIKNGINVAIDTLLPGEELTISFKIGLDNDVTQTKIDNTASLLFDGKSKNSNTASIATDYKEVEKSEVEKSEVGKSEVEKSEVEKSEVEKSEVEKSEVEKSEVEKSEVEKSEVASAGNDSSNDDESASEQASEDKSGKFVQMVIANTGLNIVLIMIALTILLLIIVIIRKKNNE